ncbi:hypothetical protein BAU15_10375 [Enterococcus sp. JM4C]|uniref:ABC transporter permease n=1 Tax=Candidatus Enterococcus huntleyi TaxID=1857217 RepID=UPI001379C434|nr:ABC transporter permease [Enterococcus sp. JM4C]KAF1296184.1 hypothetical protein BAU15_10375 [Enterococcus sp. JM4C]
MKVRNNNRSIIRTLAKADYAHNKFRNWLMIGAVATTVLVLFCIFSFMKGRIDAEYLMEVRHNGSTNTAILNRPTTRQKKEIDHLPYIEKTGKINSFAVAKTEGVDRFAGVGADEAVFTDLFLPAYSDVHGKYPKSSDELMLSVRGLEELGIKEPKVGMKIPVEIHVDAGKTKHETFILSGYYTDYVHPIEGPPIGFFAESYLYQWGLSLNQATNLLIQQKNWYTGTEVEKWLYRDIKTMDELQRFESENSVNYNVIMRTIGGYDIALISMGILLLCVFLLNYNIMNISINRQVRYYGLLKTIGATNRQIRKTIYQQFAKVSVLGLVLGSGLSLVIVLGIVPRLLENFYLNNYGLSSQMMRFEPLLLVVSLVIALLISFISILFPAYKAGKITPMESLAYSGLKVSQKNNRRKSQKKNRKKQQSPQLFRMAWRNMWRTRRSTILSLTSIFLGLAIALGSIVVVTALDYTNNFKSFADFTLTSTYHPDGLETTYDETYLSVTLEEADYLTSLEGIEKAEVVYGGYIKIDYEETVWQPYLRDSAERFNLGEEDTKIEMQELKRDPYTTLLIADNSYLDQLEKHVQDNQLPLDVQGLRVGTSVVSTEGMGFSEKLLKKTYSEIGQTIHLTAVQTNSQPVTKQFGGYFDSTVEGSPHLYYPFKIGPELIMNESSFLELGLSKRPLEISLYVEEEKEPVIKQKLKKLIAKKTADLPPSEQEFKLPHLNINSERLAEAQDEIKTMKIAMYSISFLLVSLGLVNYINTTISGLLSRRSEFAVMESIGMTRKQLRKLLILEGLFYSGVSSLLLATIGSTGLVLLFKLVKSRLGYAQFFFPYLPMLVIICSLFLICTSIPLFIYRRITHQSVIERLRETME